jgi:hypothetical protein
MRWKRGSDEEADDGREAQLTEIATCINELDRKVYTSDDLARAGAIDLLDYG